MEATQISQEKFKREPREARDGPERKPVEATRAKTRTRELQREPQEAPREIPEDPKESQCFPRDGFSTATR